MRQHRATRVYYAYNGLASLFYALCFTLNLVYHVTVVGLTPLQLVVVGTVLELTCFVFEVPTGVVADLYSRRLSLVIGFSLIGGGFLLQGLVPTFWAMVLAQIIWGVGYTFTSGASQAWLTDEIGDEHVQPVFTREHQISLGMSVVGIVLAGALGLWSIQAPLVASGVGMGAVALLLVLVMPETGFRPAHAHERETFARMAATLRDGIVVARSRRVVRAFLLIALLAGLSSEAVDRLWQARVLTDIGLPALGGLPGPAPWFALFALIGTGISIVVSLAVNRWAPVAVAAPHPHRLLAGLMGLQVVGVAGIAVFGNLWAVLTSLWARDAAQTVAYPIQSAWLNRHLDSRSRATVLSMTGQADAIGQVVGGPPLGAVATRYGIPLALGMSAAILTPAAGIYARLGASQGEDSGQSS